MREPVDIIMRSKNSGWVIDQALAALFAQQGVPFRLHVVDSGSTDDTLNIIKQYDCSLHKISPDSYIPGPVLNEAITRTRSDIVVFLNSDGVLLSRESLLRLVRSMESGEIDGAFGRQLPRPEAELWVQRDYASSFPNAPETPPWLPFSLVFSAIRRESWERRPFYSEAWGSEDTEWGSTHSIRYVPDAICMHSHNYTFQELYGRKFIEGEADAFIYDKVPSTLRTTLDAAAAASRDLLFYLSKGALGSTPKAALRRAVGTYAYHRGLQLGYERRLRGDTDLSRGQRVVLERRGPRA